MDIEQQKEMAKHVYAKLKLADPDCILAGGAPRDWYFNTPCNDLDFYFCSTTRTMGATRKQLEMLGFEGVRHVSDPFTSELYKSMEGLVRIWEWEYQGMTVQFIQLSEPKHRWSVVDNMDISICKAYCLNDTDLTIRLHKDFKLTVASGVMFLKDGYDWSQKHATKMKERFKGRFVAGTKDYAESLVVHKALQEIDK